MEALLYNVYLIEVWLEFRNPLPGDETIPLFIYLHIGNRIPLGCLFTATKPFSQLCVRDR